MSIARPYSRNMCQPIRGGTVRGGPARAVSPATDVFLLAGQSNMVGRAAFDGGAGYPANVLQYDMTGQLVPASSPLDHHDENAGQMGLALQFSIDYLAANPGRDLVLVPAADGGTGFSTGHWAVGAPHYTALVSRANALFAANPGFRLKGILWHQGESDVGNASYQTDLDAMLAGLRNDITAASETTPIILGELVPDFVAASAARATINAIIADTPNRVPYTAVVSNAGTTDKGDDLHFDAASLRLLGSRYVAALATAAANLPVAAQPPAAITDLAAVPGDGQVSLTWSAPADNGSPITDYLIERSPDGSNWSALSDGISATPGHVDTGLANGVVQHYRVAAVNAEGTGAFSSPVQATPVAPASQPVAVLASGFAADMSDLTSYSFPGLNVGAGGTVVVAAVSRRNASAPGTSAVRVNGVPATLFGLHNDSGNYIRFGYVEAVPGGTADIEVDVTAKQSRLGVHVWTLENADMSAAQVVDSAGDAAIVDAVGDGAVLAVGISVTPATPAMSWTGLDERTPWTDYGDTFGSGAADRVFGADAPGHAVSFASDGTLPTLSLLSVPSTG